VTKPSTEQAQAKRSLSYASISAFVLSMTATLLRILSVFAIWAASGAFQGAVALTCDDLPSLAKKMLEEQGEVVLREGPFSDADMCRLLRDTDIPRENLNIQALEYLATCPGIGPDAERLLANTKVVQNFNKEMALDYCAKAGLPAGR
jgi:hypothetical protein